MSNRTSRYGHFVYPKANETFDRITRAAIRTAEEMRQRGYTAVWLMLSRLEYSQSAQPEIYKVAGLERVYHIATRAELLDRRTE